MLWVVLNCAYAVGQNNEFFEPFAHVRECHVLTGPASKEAAQACEELIETVARFQVALNNEKSSVPQAYVGIARNEGKELDAIIGKKHITDTQVAEIRTITRDLNIKLEAFYDFASSRGSQFPKISVAAHTKSNSMEKSGYEVWWAYFSDRNNPNAYIKFSRDSSPATDQFYPGVYMMYTVSGHRKGLPIQVAVDSTNSPYEFDLPIP